MSLALKFLPSPTAAGTGGRPQLRLIFWSKSFREKKKKNMTSLKEVRAAQETRQQTLVLGTLDTMNLPVLELHWVGWVIKCWLRFISILTILSEASSREFSSCCQDVINWELANSFSPRAVVFDLVTNPSKVFSICNFSPASPFPL